MTRGAVYGEGKHHGCQHKVDLTRLHRAMCRRVQQVQCSRYLPESTGAMLSTSSPESALRSLAPLSLAVLFARAHGPSTLFESEACVGFQVPSRSDVVCDGEDM